jgi:hypothetical protein
MISAAPGSNDMDDRDDIVAFDSPEAITAMRRRHLELGLRMQRVAIAALEELEQKVAASKPLGLTAEDAKTLFDAGAKLEHAALGEKDQDDDASISPKKPN